MWYIRAMFLSLLITAALPWGAYAHGRSMPDRAGTPPEPYLSAPLHHEAVIGQPHRCRAATLPGSTCGPQLLLPAALHLPLSSLIISEPPRPDRGRHSIGIPAMAALGPPRPV